MKTFGAGAALVLGLGLPAVLSGCEELQEIQEGLCCSKFKLGADLSGVDFGAGANFNLLMQGIADIGGVANGAVLELAATCKALAVDLGADPSSVTTSDPGTAATQWCASAAGQIKAVVKAQGSITVQFQPPSCSVEINAQASCDASCKVDAACDPGGVEASCEPGQLSVKCEGGCQGTCEGSANLAVTCEGKCGGTCEGQCSGTCSAMGPGGNCKGSCNGKCTGECRGSCEVEAGAMVECSGECSGSCMGTAKAPKCKVKAQAPKCQLDADCSASCNASLDAKAECKPPSVEIVATGNVSVQALGSLKLHLPNFILIAEATLGRLEGAVKATVDAAAHFDPGQLSGEAALCIIPAGAAIEQALANIEASVTATASVAAEIGI